MLSRIGDYYGFVDYFLRHVLQELLPFPMGHFSPTVLKRMRISLNPMGYFWGADFTFIRFHGFPSESF